MVRLKKLTGTNFKAELGALMAVVDEESAIFKPYSSDAILEF